MESFVFAGDVQGLPSAEDFSGEKEAFDETRTA